jgi:hypothetical protein
MDASQSTSTETTVDPHSRSARIRAFRALQRAPPEERERMRRAMNEEARVGGTWTAVHLLSASEVRSLFGDVVDGLAFLVSYVCNLIYVR